MVRGDCRALEPGTTFDDGFFSTMEIAAARTAVGKPPMAAVPGHIFFYGFKSVLVIANIQRAIAVDIKDETIEPIGADLDPFASLDLRSVHRGTYISVIRKYSVIVNHRWRQTPCRCENPRASWRCHWWVLGPELSEKFFNGL